MGLFQKLFQKLGVELNPICPDCDGRGSWALEEYDEQNQITERVIKHCETCKGTGRKQEVDGDVD